MRSKQLLNHLLATLIITQTAHSAFAAERPKRPPPAVTAYDVATAELPQHYVSSGTLSASKTAELRIETSGRISKLHVQAGQRVDEGTLLLSIDSRAAKAELQRLESQLNLARQQLDRQQSLVKKAAGATEKVDILSAEVAGLEANLRIARLTIERFDLYAPFSGVLGGFDWVEGGWIGNSQPFTTLDDTRTLKVSFDIPERYLRFIAEGRRVEIVSAAWSEQTFEGEVSLLETRMDAQRATLGVEALIDNSDGLLRPGMRVSVKLRVDSGEQKLVVPARSLIHEGDQATVLKLDADSKAKATPVSLGQQTGEWVEITEGLSIGDQIVDRGLVKAKPNRPVKVLTADAQEGQGRKGDKQRQRPQS